MGNAFVSDEQLREAPSPNKEVKCINVEVNCSHDGKCISFSQHQGRNVTATWSATRLHEAIEALTGVHRSSQRLMFRGKVMEGLATIESILGCDPEALPGRKIKLYLFVDRHHFPQKLGPFSLVPVQFQNDDFELPHIGEESRRTGFYWNLPQKALKRHALEANGQISGQVSPLHSVSSDFAQLSKSGLPAGAQDFVWSYPVENWSSVESDAFVMDTWASVGSSDFSAVKSFLSVGGFMFLDASNEVVGVTTIGPVQEGVAASLHFGESKRWLPEWTMALAEQGRFQTVTINSLRAVGAELYLWLRPNEVIEGPDGNPLSRQPSVPFGGFVYLFHRDLASTDPSVVALDRYFGMLDRPPEPEPDDSGTMMVSATTFRSFTLAEPEAPQTDVRFVIEPPHHSDNTDALSDISVQVGGSSYMLTTPRVSPGSSPQSSPIATASGRSPTLSTPPTTTLRLPWSPGATPSPTVALKPLSFPNR